MGSAITGQPAGRPGIIHRANVRWSVILPTLFITMTVGQIDKINVGIITAYPPFLQAMGLAHRPALIGLLTTVFLIAYGVSMPFWGRIVDRIGPRRAGLWAMAVWLVMMCVGGAAGRLWELFVSRIGLGFAEGVLWPMNNRFTVEWFPPTEQARATAFWINGINLGAAVAAALITAILSAAGWRPAFFVLAGLALVPITLVALATRDRPEEMARVTPEERAWIRQGQAGLAASARPVAANYRLYLVTIANIATGMTFWGINAWVPKYLTSVRHLSLGHMGAFLTLAYLLCMGVLFAISAWADRVGRLAPFGLASYVVFAGIMWLAAVTSSVTWAVILIGLSIWTVFVATLVLFAMVRRFGAAHEVGTGTGLMAGLSNIVASAAPTVMGFMIGLEQSYVGAFLFLSGMAVVGAIMMAILLRQGY
jgi:ACS family glucarate transporter-like MFS transporter